MSATGETAAQRPVRRTRPAGGDRRRRASAAWPRRSSCAGTASSDVTILEKAPDLGGTWFYNSYPGAACDVPSHLYSFSYAQRRDWTRLCSPQAEIHSYLREVAREHGIEALVRTGRTVTRLHLGRGGACSWTVRPAEGESYEADALVLATGQLHQPARPRIEGPRASPATASTRPTGTTTTSWRASASASSAPARAPCSSCPRSRRRCAAPDRLPAHRQLVPAAPQPALPGRRRMAFERLPRAAGAPSPVRLPVQRVADARDPPSRDLGRIGGARARRPSCARS